MDCTCKYNEFHIDSCDNLIQPLSILFYIYFDTLKTDFQFDLKNLLCLYVHRHVSQCLLFSLHI